MVWRSNTDLVLSLLGHKLMNDCYITFSRNCIAFAYRMYFMKNIVDMTKVLNVKAFRKILEFGVVTITQSIVKVKRKILCNKTYTL